MKIKTVTRFMEPSNFASKRCQSLFLTPNRRDPFSHGIDEEKRFALEQIVFGDDSLLYLTRGQEFRSISSR
jgi:hypothetical protein